MKKPLILLSLIASMCAGAAFAQSADGGDPATPPVDPTALDLGETARNVPYVKEVYDDWNLNCIKDDNDQEICQMVQLLDDGNGSPVGQVVLHQVQNGGKAVAGGSMTFPLGTALKPKLRMSIDGREAKFYDFSFCTRDGCTAMVGFTEDDIVKFKAGKEAAIVLIPFFAPNQTVSLTLSLKGFTAAFDETSRLDP